MSVSTKDLAGVVAWVEKHGFERVAVQLPCELLGHGPDIVFNLKAALPGRELFLLGDSTWGAGVVDEVGGQHYGADCVVHVGPSDQLHSCSVPALFVFQRASLSAESESALFAGVGRHDWAGETMDSSAGSSNLALVLVCDVSAHHLEDRLAQALQAQLPEGGAMYVAVPQTGVSGPALRGPSCRDWRFGVFSLAKAWWARVGPITLAAAGRCEPLRICGREVRRLGHTPLGPPGSEARRHLRSGCGIVCCGPAGSPLERRLMLRYAEERPLFRLELETGEVARLANVQLLTRRYRFVEVAQTARVFGLLTCSAGGFVAREAADRLEAVLERSGRRCYRFSMGKIAPEKLGNFNGVDCWISLAGPENFPWDVRDFHVPIASPYEVEVALGVREWTGSYITDLEEFLRDPVPPCLVDDEPVLTPGSRHRPLFDVSCRS